MKCIYLPKKAIVTFIYRRRKEPSRQEEGGLGQEAQAEKRLVFVLS
jgi:hypothetical protein